MTDTCVVAREIYGYFERLILRYGSIVSTYVSLCLHSK